MKALVTGANGFTGSHLVRELLNQGHTVKGLVRKSSNLSRLANCDLELVYGDITNRQILQDACADIDAVFHIAAYVDLGLVNDAEMERVNVKGTRTVLEVTQAAGVSKIVYCSTIGVYGDTKAQVVDENFQRTQQDFSSAYDRTKYQAQQLVKKFFQQGLPVVSIMPSGILGIDDPHFGPVIELFLKRRLKLWPGGNRITGIVHVNDLVNGIILAAEKGIPGEDYIISAGELTSREMFQIFSQETGIPIPAEPPQFLVRLAGSLLDPIGKLFSWNPPLSRERVHYIYDRCVRVKATKAGQELGWQPHSVSEILRELVRLKK